MSKTGTFRDRTFRISEAESGPVSKRIRLGFDPSTSVSCRQYFVNRREQEANDKQYTIRAENPCAPDSSIISLSIRQMKCRITTAAIIFEIYERHTSNVIHNWMIGKVFSQFMTEARRKFGHPGLAHDSLHQQQESGKCTILCNYPLRM